MKKLTTLTLIGASALTLAAGAASAQPYGRGMDRGWMPIDQRLRNLDQRIDQGIRRGDLSRQEAMRLRGEFRQLVRLQSRYSRNGLSGWERADLDHRFDRLSAQIRWDRHDNQYGYGYGPQWRR